jgi:hypothetical protein
VTGKQKLKAFQIKLYEPKTENLTRIWRKLHREKLCGEYNSLIMTRIIKEEHEMTGT